MCKENVHGWTVLEEWRTRILSCKEIEKLKWVDQVYAATFFSFYGHNIEQTGMNLET